MNIRKRVGLARALSKLGYCSRSQAAILIRNGSVTLNGRIVRDPEIPARLPQERIEVHGSPLAKAPLIYLVMNKPRGVVTTASDEKGRKTVYGLLAPDLPWVGPVGRLDKASEGLLLLTNDSGWAAKITDPATHLDKKYHVQVNRVIDADLQSRITGGRALDGRSDGISKEGRSDKRTADEPLRVKDAHLLRHGDKNSWLEITLDEGKNRQIRRLLQGLNVEVLRLVRVSIGPLELGDLKKGTTRHLTSKEKRVIDRALSNPRSRTLT